MVAKVLENGISGKGRAGTYHRRGLWAIKKKNGGKFPVTKPKAKAAEPAKKAPKFYAPEDVPKPFNRNSVKKPTKLRASITPGTVLILLAGAAKGKRVVFLKQLASGLLLVSGPFQANGVPLRRVNQAYVIATSTKVDVAKVDTKKFDDAYFKKPKSAKTKKSEGDFVDTDDAKRELPAQFIADQKAVDAAIMGGLDETLKGYLATKFTLKSGMYPHQLVF